MGCFITTPSSRQCRSMLPPCPKGISCEACEHIALLYIAFAGGKHIAPSYARHFFPKLATVSLVSFTRPKGISREPCEHIALLYIAFASGKHIAPSYARHFFPQARADALVD